MSACSLINPASPSQASPRGRRVAQPSPRSRTGLDILGLSARINHLPKDLSGGEQQRVAIARAIINEPKIIIADEPTGNLDKNTSYDVFEHLIDFVYSQKISLIMATHNLELASKSDHQIKLV